MRRLRSWTRCCLLSGCWVADTIASSVNSLSLTRLTFPHADPCLSSFLFSTLLVHWHDVVGWVLCGVKDEIWARAKGSGTLRCNRKGFLTWCQWKSLAHALVPVGLMNFVNCFGSTTIINTFGVPLEKDTVSISGSTAHALRCIGRSSTWAIYESCVKSVILYICGVLLVKLRELIWDAVILYPYRLGRSALNDHR